MPVVVSPRDSPGNSRRIFPNHFRRAAPFVTHTRTSVALSLSRAASTCPAFLRCEMDSPRPATANRFFDAAKRVSMPRRARGTRVFWEERDSASMRLVISLLAASTLSHERVDAERSIAKEHAVSPTSSRDDRFLFSPFCTTNPCRYVTARYIAIVYVYRSRRLFSACTRMENALRAECLVPFEPGVMERLLPPSVIRPCSPKNNPRRVLCDIMRAERRRV